MLLSGLVLSRWCEYYLMQWSLSRKMTSNRARYLNQELIVLVRCRKPVIFRVGICVGIRWYCLLLTILNHEVKSHVWVRPSHLRTFAPSHLRTIGTSIDINGRFFMTEIRATQGFSLFFAQPKSTYINLLMWIQLQLRLYPDSIMFVPTQNPWKATRLKLSKP